MKCVHFQDTYTRSLRAFRLCRHFCVQWPATGDAYVPLTADDIALEQQELIRNVQDLTAVEGHISRQLLQEMKWSYESVAEVYYEDPERLLAKAGVTVTEAAASRKSLGHEKSGMNIEYNGSFTCQVCFDTFEGEEIVAKVCSFPTCGHAMCTDCWFQQLKTQIIDEGASVKIACPGFSTVDNKIVRCNVILDERFVGQVLKKVEDVGTNPDAKRTRQRYHKQLNDNYVNNNYCIKWCPVRVLSLDCLFFWRAPQCVCCAACKPHPHDECAASLKPPRPLVFLWFLSPHGIAATRLFGCSYIFDVPNCTTQ